MRDRLSLTLAVLLLGGSLFAQSPASNRQQLTGTWKLDKSAPPEDEKNWKRPDRRKVENPVEAALWPTGTAPAPEWGKVTSISRFGRTLIAPSETVVFQVQPDSATMRDDFREPTRYETNGRARTIEVLAGSAQPRGAFGSPSGSFTVSVKTSWNGDAFVQELWTRDLTELVRVTRTFISFDEGRKILLVIKVLEPKLKEPVKDIERVYLRSLVPGPGPWSRGGDVQARLSLALIVLLAAASLFAQRPSPPPALDRQWLAGTWKLDKSGLPEDEKNWKRPTGRTPDGSGMKPIPDFWGTYSVSTFGQTLIAPSETLVLNVQGDAVTIADDFREQTRYDPRRSSSLKMLTRRAYTSEAGWVSPPDSITFSVKTSWQSDTLTQELWTRDLPRIVRMTRTFLRSDGGRQMLLVIKVLEPKLKEPVKDIERVYVRSLVPGPGSSVLWR